MKGNAIQSRFCSKAAFTLIELLVVVLIIGILAAVAVPQYQFAVDKSRVAPIVSNIQNIIRAEQVYKVADGDYTPNLSLLDTDVTKICPRIRESNNELIGCQGGFGINMPTNDGINFSASGAVVGLLYCQDPSVECFSDVGSFHFEARFDINNGRAKRCTSYTPRGQKLCKWLKPE